MKQYFVVLGCVVTILVLFIGCTQQSAHRGYSNVLYGFSMDPPVGWTSVENESVDVVVRFTPLNETSVSLLVEPPVILSEGLALSTFADTVEENLSASGMNYTMVYREWRSIPGVTAYEIAYSYEEGKTVQRVKQVAIQRTRTVFLVTFTAPSALYIRYLTSVDQSIDTFL